MLPLTLAFPFPDPVGVVPLELLESGEQKLCLIWLFELPAILPCPDPVLPADKETEADADPEAGEKVVRIWLMFRCGSTEENAG